MTPTTTGSALDGAAALALWDQLPVGLGVIDAIGTIRYANRRIEEMIGYTSDELVGRSTFDFLDPTDTEELIAGIARAGDFRRGVLGPVRMRWRHKRGTWFATECWSDHAPAALGFEGFVVTITPEATPDLIAAATRGIAGGDELKQTLTTLARALEAHPVDAIGSILLVDGGMITDLIGTWAFPDRRVLLHPENPWVGVAAGTLDGGVWSHSELPRHTARLARSHGLGSVWVRPIDTEGARRAVMVAWRTDVVTPSPNQEAHIREALTAASMAFSAHDHRSQLQRAAHEDHLTGVGNRARLDYRIRHAPSGPSGVLFIDLDFFKAVNDRYGHQTGDRVLRTAAERLTRLVRPQDEVYRVGGDEFVIVCGPSYDIATARRLSEQMARFVVEAICEPIELDGATVEIGASVGVDVALPETGLGRVIERADEAMLEAKRSGRGRWISFRLPESA